MNKGVLIQKGTWIACSNPIDDDVGDFEDQTYYFQVEYTADHSGGIFQIVLEEAIIRNSFIIGSNKAENILFKLEKE